MGYDIQYNSKKIHEKNLVKSLQNLKLNGNETLVNCMTEHYL